MLLTLALALAAAGDKSVDADRASWRYKREVSVSSGASLVSLTLPPELSQKAGAFGRDLRLVDGNGRETPYILDWTSEREGLATWQASITNIRREQEEATAESANRSQWTIDLGAERSFTEITLNIPDASFAWHVRVETSMDGKNFRVVSAHATLFDQTWNDDRVRKTTIAFDAPLKARSLRVTARSAADSPMLEITGASVTLRRRLKADQWSMPVTATLEENEADPMPGWIRYRLDVSSLLPFDEVEVGSDDAAFSRQARLVEETTGGGRKKETKLGEGPLFRLRSSDTVVAGETTTFATRNGSGGALVLEIDNRGSPPLRGVRVRLKGSRMRLLFPAPGGPLTLYYGNATTRAARYDLEGLRPQLIQAATKETAALGPERLNPLFQREPPLRFPAKVGASLDSSRWRRERVLQPLLEEDVYALTLKSQDLASLRADLADLRLVNDDDQQVPFLIDRDYAEERVALKVGKVDASASRRSRYELTPPENAFAGANAPSISRLDLEIDDPYFARQATLVDPDRDGRRDPVVALTLARRPPDRSPLIFGVSVPLKALALDVDDGDNAPLNLVSAVATVRVPRIVFKAAPGKLHLLLGNATAEPPRYDIAGLRDELLAYSAVNAVAGELEDNEGLKETLGSRLETAPRGALVWAAIIVAVIALIGLTLKTIKSA